MISKGIFIFLRKNLKSPLSRPQQSVNRLKTTVSYKLNRARKKIIDWYLMPIKLSQKYFFKCPLGIKRASLRSVFLKEYLKSLLSRPQQFVNRLKTTVSYKLNRARKKIIDWYLMPVNLSQEYFFKCPLGIKRASLRLASIFEHYVLPLVKK